MAWITLQTWKWRHAEQLWNGKFNFYLVYQLFSKRDQTQFLVAMNEWTCGEERWCCSSYSRDGESDKVYSEARLEVAGYVHVMNGKGFLFSVFNS